MFPCKNPKKIHFQLSFYMCVTVGLDLLQIWVAPNQHFCFVKNFFKSPVLVMIALSLCFTTILKFYVLATKSIPEMDEIRVAKKAIFIIFTTTFTIISYKFSGEIKPTFNQVLENDIQYSYSQLFCLRNI